MVQRQRKVDGGDNGERHLEHCLGLCSSPPHQGQDAGALTGEGSFSAGLSTQSCGVCLLSAWPEQDVGNSLQEVGGTGGGRVTGRVSGIQASLQGPQEGGRPDQNGDKWGPGP